MALHKDTLEERVRRLEERLDRLTVQPGIPSYPVAPLTPVAGCLVCGLKWDGPMGYVCVRADCPSGVRCSA